MLTNCLAMLALIPSADVHWEAAVTSSCGHVVIERENRSYRAVHGAGVRAQDRIRVNESGGISFYLPGEHVVYLGANSVATLLGEPGAWRIVLHRGEARVTSSSPQSLIVQAKWGQAAVNEGIVRALAGKQESQFFAERGVVEVASRSQRKYRVQEGYELSLMAGDAKRVGKGMRPKWSIRPADFQLVAAIAAQPELTVPEDATQQEIPSAPEPDGDSPSDNSTSDQDVSPDDEQPPDDDQPESTARGEGSDDASQEPTPESNDVALNTNAGAGSSLTLGSLASSLAGSSSSGGLFSDANQQTLQGQLTAAAPQLGLSKGDPFPGNIHLVTTENKYEFDTIKLTPPEQQQIFGSNTNGNANVYWSIGTGTVPTSQVFTDLLTGTDPIPTTVKVPHFDAYLVRLDQYGIPDPAIDPVAAETSNVGVTGLLGDMPAAPTIIGATPLTDTRAEFNPRATFALGEFRLSQDGDSIAINIRRSDQDRTIVKDPGGNDALDQVTVNPQVAEFADVPDPRFLPQIPTVKVPRIDAFNSAPNRFSNLDFLRKAATTTLMADQLHDFAHRTGQTRFVVREADGTRNIVDITGYQKP